MNYRHALVCINLRSVNAQHLLERALELVGGDGRLSVVTVIEVGTFDDDREAVASMIEEEYEVCSAHLARLCQAAGHGEADQRVLVGKAAGQIAAYAREHDCDLVVLGEHDSRPTRPRLGATADTALRLLACDALVVRNLPV